MKKSYDNCRIVLVLMMMSLYTWHSTAQDEKPLRPFQRGLRTVITGILPFNSGDSKFWIADRSKFDYTWYDDSTTSIKAELDSGHFKLILYLNAPTYVMPAIAGAASLAPGSVFRNQFSTRYISLGMLVEPGDSINVIMKSSIEKVTNNISFAPGLFEGIPFFNLLSFSGKGAEKLQCILEIIKNTQLYTYPNGNSALVKLKFSDSVSEMVINTVRKYEKNISPTAATIIKAHYVPMLAEDISEIIIDNKLNIHSASVQELFKKRISAFNRIIAPSDPSLKYAFFYYEIIPKRALLQNAMDNGLEYNYNEYGHGNNENEYDALVKYVQEGPIKEKILARYVQASLRAEGLNGNGESLARRFLASSRNNSSFHKGVERYLNYFQHGFEKGNQASLFQLLDEKSQIVKLSDFMGKVVLIDFMFTGCKGCIQMVPALTRVEEQYKDNPDIVFLSISISPNTNEDNGWKAGIGKYSVAGSIQLCAGGTEIIEGYHNPIIKDYGINLFPQLVLIDKKGKIVTNTAPRPDRDNGDALKVLIEDALKDYSYSNSH